MDYKEALKSFQEYENIKKENEHFIIMELDYNHSIIVPYRDGLELMQSLRNAELVKGSPYNITEIKPLTEDILKFRTLSANKYRLIKMAKLMGISVNELENQEAKDE